tara:strand:+ start:4695 stop:6257 length:1563 start_codon:yes stop_codon:yes gene_type:complete
MKLQVRSISVFCFLVTFSIPVFSQLKNVQIDAVPGKNEPSICINPNNPNQIIAGTNRDFYFVSNDGGKTWKTRKLTSSFGVWGDPVIACDTSGDFYFFHLSNPPRGNWIDRIVCQKTTDGGKTWNDGSFVGLDGTKAQDKEWVSIDRRTNTIYMTWTQFDAYGKRDSNLFSNIMFSKSEDGGDTWKQAVQINEVSGDCIDSSNTTEGAVPAVGPNGEVYVSWAGPAGLVFDKSLDGGKTWMAKDKLIDSLKAGWNYDVPGIMRCNGLPVTVCDLSSGKHRGTIYVNWSDQRNGKDNTDIWLKKSTDGGKTWSALKRINDDSTKNHQFLTWMTVDQSTGFLYFIWYDRRNYSDNKTDVYMAVSYDGGETFENKILSEQPFDPDESVFFGDYTNISAVGGNVRPIWTIMNNGKTEIWTALYTEQKIGLAEEKETNWAVDSYPNPFNTEATIAFTLKSAQKVKISLYDLDGKKLVTIQKKKKFKEGENQVTFKAVDYNLASGSYVYVLECNEMVVRKRLVFAP